MDLKRPELQPSTTKWRGRVIDCSFITAYSGAAIGLLAACALPVAGQAYAQDALVVERPWARATPPGAQVAGGYATIENTSDEADRLVSASAEIAGRAAIHEMAVVDGVMTMRPLEEGIEIPAGGTVELKPGSYHVMMTDLARPLVEGKTFAGTLSFENAGDVDVTYAIGPIGSASPPLLGQGSHDAMSE
jgi:copper(I)-binding protein